MTLKELFSIQADMNKLKSLNLELANMEAFNPYRNNIITDMPRGGGGKDMSAWYVEEKDRLEREIDACKVKLQEDRKMVNEYIEAAPLPERDIIRYRVVNNMSWDDIGVTVGYSRRGASTKFYNYIKSLP